MRLAYLLFLLFTNGCAAGYPKDWTPQPKPSPPVLEDCPTFYVHEEPCNLVA